MTENMRLFVGANKQSNSIFAENLSKSGGEFKNMKDACPLGSALYRLEDGRVFIITRVDRNSATDYKPNWYD